MIDRRRDGWCSAGSHLPSGRAPFKCQTWDLNHLQKQSLAKIDVKFFILNMRAGAVATARRWVSNDKAAVVLDTFESPPTLLEVKIDSTRTSRTTLQAAQHL